jgi:hypothetical protein
LTSRAAVTWMSGGGAVAAATMTPAPTRATPAVTYERTCGGIPSPSRRGLLGNYSSAVRARPEFARWPVSNGSSIDVESDHRDLISSGPDLLRLIKRFATDCPPSTAFAGLRTRERRAISERRRKQDVVRATLLRASWDGLAGGADRREEFAGVSRCDLPLIFVRKGKNPLFPHL